MNASTIDLSIRPHHVGHSVITQLCVEMHAAGRSELVHYAGACYRDQVAWQMCIAWVADPIADESTLKSRAYKATYNWDLTPADCSH